MSLFRYILCATAMAGPILGQTLPRPVGDELYRLFFSQVSSLGEVSGPVSINGELVGLRTVTLQEAIGITDDEAVRLRDAANKCLNNINAVQSETRPWLFAARMDAIVSEQAAAVLAARMKDMDRRIGEIISGTLEDLKLTLGSETFRKLDEFITRNANPHHFFPSVAAEGGKMPPLVKRAR
ncbi:MAG TPA: hypothetical protein VER03_22005 [Bryobacteraceae bacterium]|nr:hypothetical protein [Bryobacteraceae bacterium]